MDLRTTYMGLALKNPVVPSASPMSYHLDTMKRLEDAGAAAVVMYSLFEEDIQQESLALNRYLEEGTESYAEALTYLPELPEYAATKPDKYLDEIRSAKAALEIPVIASLNGVSSGGWVHYAKLMEEAGADGLELNMYYLPTNPHTPAENVEDMYSELIAIVRREVEIPLAVKIHPFFSSLPYTTRRFARAGANGLVMFNRFYQPDYDLETMEVTPRVHLSDSSDLLLPLRWTAILFGQVEADIAITSGVHTALDVLKGVMAGASVTMMASALLRHGPMHLVTVLSELVTWMDVHEYESIAQMRGSLSLTNAPDASAIERANYRKVLKSFHPSGW